MSSHNLYIVFCAIPPSCTNNIAANDVDDAVAVAVVVVACCCLHECKLVKTIDDAGTCSSIRTKLTRVRFVRNSCSNNKRASKRYTIYGYATCKYTRATRKFSTAIRTVWKKKGKGNNNAYLYYNNDSRSYIYLYIHFPIYFVRTPSNTRHVHVFRLQIFCREKKDVQLKSTFACTTDRASNKTVFWGHLIM